jgi:hypothetical protein
MKDSGRRWLIAAVGLFLFLLVGWVLLALQLNSALAGPLPFGPGLMSKLSADYRADEGGRSVMLISLSIMNEALNDAMQTFGLTEEEAVAAHESVELAMSQPVPTATAMDFEGAEPFTATPTVTNTPLPTDTPTPIPTNTRRPPTRTPVPTKTDTSVPGPTNTPSGPTATGAPPTATSGPDTIKPVVDASGAAFLPTPGPITTCVLTVSNVHITDAIGSSGISDSQVGIKYDPGPGYVFLYGMTHTGGFQIDTSWDATYSGTFTLTGVTVSGPATPPPYKHLDIYVFAYDNAGKFDFDSSDFDYDVYRNCP